MEINTLKMISNTTEGMVVGVLVGLSVQDIRCRRISKRILLLLGMIVFGSLLVLGKYKRIGLTGLIMGVAVGMLFLLIGRLTREAIGYGDGVVITILGGYLGFWKIIEILAGAFFLSGIYAIGWMSARKFRREIMTKETKTIPFLPFLTIGYVLVIVENGGAV